MTDDGDDGQEDMVAARVGGGEGVEDGGEDGDGYGGTELRGGGNGFGEVGADTGKEDVRVGGLVDEVDEEVVGGRDFCLVRELNRNAESQTHLFPEQNSAR